MQTCSTPMQHQRRGVSPATSAKSPAPDKPAKRTQAARRIIAAAPCDMLICYWISACLVVSLSILTKGLSLRFTPLALMALCLFLTRDFFFEGRGISRNLFELQVVDRKTGMVITLVQSLKRNFVLAGPFIIMESLSFFLSLICSSETRFVSMAKIIAMGCFTVLAVIDGILIHRGSGVTLGDILAGTVVVNAKTNFRSSFRFSRIHLQP